MENNIIFVGGIHGVGKGTICKYICDLYPFKHLSASEVLKWEDISLKQNKKVKNVQSTQSRLLENLKKIISSSSSSNYLLDGHFCLLNKNGIPEKIQKSTFISINPKAIILIKCSIDKVINRLHKRDNIKYDYNTLKKMQSIEIQYSKDIARELKIPIIEINNKNDISLYNFFKNYENIN